jgi:hypothetical protein
MTGGTRDGAMETLDRFKLELSRDGSPKLWGHQHTRQSARNRCPLDYTRTMGLIEVPDIRRHKEELAEDLATLRQNWLLGQSALISFAMSEGCTYVA